MINFSKVSLLLLMCASLVLTSCSGSPKPPESSAAASNDQTSSTPEKVTPPPSNAGDVQTAEHPAEQPRESRPQPLKPKPAKAAPLVAKSAPAAAPVTVPEKVSPPADVPSVATTPEPPATPVLPPEPPKPTTHRVTLPSGTLIPVRTLDSLDSRTDGGGPPFRASLDEPVTVAGATVLPRGANVDLKRTEVARAGDIKGQSQLELQLTRIMVGSTSYVVESNVFQTSGDSQGKKTARNAGIGAAIGAAIGAIAGGGKGAAIGATAGAGGGVAAAVITKDQVRIDSETQLTFRLERPLDITLQGPPSERAQP